MRHVGKETVFRFSGILEFNVFLMQGALNPFALGDIADGAGHQYAFLGFERAKTDLHWKFRAILAQTIELQARAHGARPRVREKAPPVRGMFVSKTVRNQNLDLSAEQFLAWIAE